MLEALRGTVMRGRGLGLTEMYRLIHDPSVEGDSDVARLRAVHREIDRCMFVAYGWPVGDLALGFHEYRKLRRFTPSRETRDMVLSELLKENHRRARAEGQDVPDQEGLF